METASNKKSFSSFFFAAVFFISATISYGDDNTNHRDFSPERNQITNNPEYQLLQGIWTDQAGKHGLDQKTIRLVCKLFRQVVESNECRKVDRYALEKSIDRYLDQFELDFKGKRSEGACYWMAFLLVQYVKSPVITGQDVTAARLSFESLIDKILNVIESNSKYAINRTDSLEFRQDLNQYCAIVKGRLLYYFYQLRNDPLFPLFKRPISSYTEQKVLERAGKEFVLGNWRDRESYFFDMSTSLMFWMVSYETRQEFRKPEYWGGMLSSASSETKGIWPIRRYLRKSPIRQDTSHALQKKIEEEKIKSRRE